MESIFNHQNNSIYNKIMADVVANIGCNVTRYETQIHRIQDDIDVALILDVINNIHDSVKINIKSKLIK